MDKYSKTINVLKKQYKQLKTSNNYNKTNNNKLITGGEPVVIATALVLFGYEAVRVASNSEMYLEEEYLKLSNEEKKKDQYDRLNKYIYNIKDATEDEEKKLLKRLFNENGIENLQSYISDNKKRILYEAKLSDPSALNNFLSLYRIYKQNAGTEALELARVHIKTNEHDISEDLITADIINNDDKLKQFLENVPEDLLKLDPFMIYASHTERLQKIMRKLLMSKHTPGIDIQPHQLYRSIKKSRDGDYSNNTVCTTVKSILPFVSIPTNSLPWF